MSRIHGRGSTHKLDKRDSPLNATAGNIVNLFPANVRYVSEARGSSQVGEGSAASKLFDKSKLTRDERLAQVAQVSTISVVGEEE